MNLQRREPRGIVQAKVSGCMSLVSGFKVLGFGIKRLSGVSVVGFNKSKDQGQDSGLRLDGFWGA